MAFEIKKKGIHTLFTIIAGINNLETEKGKNFHYRRFLMQHIIAECVQDL